MPSPRRRCVFCLSLYATLGGWSCQSSQGLPGLGCAEQAREEVKSSLQEPKAPDLAGAGVGSGEGAGAKT